MFLYSAPQKCLPLFGKMMCCFKKDYSGTEVWYKTFD